MPQNEQQVHGSSVVGANATEAGFPLLQLHMTCLVSTVTSSQHVE